MNILKVLKRSPLGLDLYMWFTYRTFSLDRPTRLSWPQLYKQLGVDPAKANGCIGRFFKTLKEQLLWVRHFRSIPELVQALQGVPLSLQPILIDQASWLSIPDSGTTTSCT